MCRYSSLDRMRSTAQAYLCPESPCLIDSSWTMFFWSLKLGDMKVARLSSERDVSEDLRRWELTKK